MRTPSTRPESEKSAPKKAVTVVVSELARNSHEIPRLRKWAHKNDCKKGIERINVLISVAPRLKDGVDQLRKDPAHTVLVTIGVEQSRVYECLTPAEAESYEVIVTSPCSPGTVPLGAESDIRKSILRLVTRQYATIGQLQRPEDFEQYFALRYKVWEEMKYIPSERRCPQSKWELDYTDRNALPIGAFSKDGQLLGAARLVRPHGSDVKRHVELIERLIEAKKDPQLVRNFKRPKGMIQQFDVLESIKSFRGYYKQLKLGYQLVAELSRVIVHPDWRRCGLGEMIVDELVSMARGKGLHTLFLACVSEHEGFYSRCGFRLIKEMACERFVNVGVPAIVMERQIGHSSRRE